MPLTLGCNCLCTAHVCAVLPKRHAPAARHAPALAPGSPYTVPLTRGQARPRPPVMACAPAAREDRVSEVRSGRALIEAETRRGADRSADGFGRGKASQ